MKNKKIAFIMLSTKLNSANRYRILQYLRYYEKDGFDYDLFFPRTKKMAGEKLSKFFLINYIKLILLLIFKNYSHIIVQRCILHPKIPIEYFFPKFIKKKLIIDIDDAVFLLSKRSYNLIIKSAAKVIVGSSYLKRYCEVYSKNVYIIPTSVDFQKIEETSQVPEKTCHSKITTLGWIGSFSGIEYLETIYEPLKQLAKSIPLELIVVSDFSSNKWIQIEGVKVINIQWHEIAEYSYFKNFDIGLMPLDKNSEFTVGKCSFKIIQYMACKVPVLCANVGNNSHVIKNAVNGYLYNNADEFISQTLKIINNSIEVKKVINNAYNDGLQKYSIENNYKLIKDIIQ